MLTIKKIIGIIVVLSVLISASTIYASGIPQHTLSKWYGQSFQEESGSNSNVISSEIIKNFEDLNTFFSKSLASLESTIKGIVDSEIKEAKSGIEGYQGDTESQLDQTVTELQKVNFDDYVDNEEIKSEVDQDIEEVLKEVFGN